MIRAKVVYKMEHMNQLYKCYSKLSLFIILFCTAIVFFGGIFELLTILIFIISGTQIPSDLVGLSIISLFLVVLAVASNVWIFFIYPRVYLKSYKIKYGDIPILYEFNENDMNTKHIGTDFEEYLKFTYDKLDKARETKKYFIFYPQRYSVFIIGKHEITEGTAEDLRNLLKRKLGKKFK